ncbi:MAG: transposase [Methylobacter sp.]|nr:transposase [Methylobacter sp.]
MVSVGLLKQVKGRWACLFLDFRFYLARKTIEAEKDNAKIKGAVVPFQTKLQQAGQMLIGIGSHFASSPLLVVTDSWFGNRSLWRPVRDALGDRFQLLSRLRCNNVLYAQPDASQPGQRGRRRKYGKRREVCAYDAVVMLKTLKRPVRVVWVFRKTQWVTMFSTDLELSVIQIIEYYGARWKIESGFKELKQDIGSRTSQCRNAQAVNNHLQFCMMASTITWIYVDRLKADPERRHKVKGRTSFAFSDVRRLIAEAALNDDFDKVCPKPGNPTKNSLMAVLLSMVA